MATLFVFRNRKPLFKRNEDISLCLRDEIRTNFGATLAPWPGVSPIRHFERGEGPGDKDEYYPLHSKDFPCTQTGRILVPNPYLLLSKLQGDTRDERGQSSILRGQTNRLCHFPPVADSFARSVHAQKSPAWKLDARETKRKAKIRRNYKLSDSNARKLVISIFAE